MSELHPASLASDIPVRCYQELNLNQVATLSLLNEKRSIGIKY